MEVVEKEHGLLRVLVVNLGWVKAEGNQSLHHVRSHHDVEEHPPSRCAAN